MKRVRKVVSLIAFIVRDLVFAGGVVVGACLLLLILWLVGLLLKRS